jgi:hypothetical protein
LAWRVPVHAALLSAAICGIVWRTKMSDTAIAPRSPQSTAIAPRSSSRLEGGDQGDLILPRVHIYQGLPAEAKQYGRGFNPGDMINTLTNEKIDSSRFVPIMGHKQWIKWKEPRGAGMEYSYRNKSEVPSDDLEWSGDTPPAAQEYINWIVLFEGQDVPMVFPFTKTSLKAGRTINTLESLRKSKTPGSYIIEMKEENNDKGTWMSPRVRPAGDPSPEMGETVEALYQSLSGRTVVAAPESGDFDPDAN